MSRINIENADKAEVLAALFNRSKQQGLGFLHSEGRAQMTHEDAQEVLKENQSFDYLRGRVMKLSLDRDTFGPFAYDRDNGQGAAWDAVKGIKGVFQVEDQPQEA